LSSALRSLLLLAGSVLAGSVTAVSGAFLCAEQVRRLLG
jgi:hypothetical protein